MLLLSSAGLCRPLRFWFFGRGRRLVHAAFAPVHVFPEGPQTLAMPSKVEKPRALRTHISTGWSRMKP